MIELLIDKAPALATIFFFSFFCWVIYYSCKKSNHKKFAKYAQIPLLDGEPIIKNIIKKTKKKKFFIWF